MTVETDAPLTDLWTTAVVDVGARYGIHPSWRGFEAPLAYDMYEPEPEEAARLTAKYASRPEVSVHPCALGGQPDTTATLWLTAHRGYAGAHKPNPDSLWFGQVRPEEGAVEGALEVPCTTLDRAFAERGRRADFLKVDVEGEERAVLEGGARTLDRVLALRVEVQFDESFERQTASEILQHLIDGHRFRLMRFDYAGRGQPLSYLVGEENYGVLTGCDAVFARRPDTVAGWGGEAAVAGLAKLAVFALRNGMADYAVVCLEYLVETGGWPEGGSGREPPLRRYLRKLFTLSALRARSASGDLYERARADYRRFFGEPMLERNAVFESDWMNPG
ncbi:FkbM family methyltransferase [Thalassobaculum sp. OXR-137]|uniref:FkbM family methyltransferase n=1 Tax=Thalassobaculum sp. OXR-137 TaxID=3100173 RepID=UPI002AC9C043|nr:FkbM family methyltransferase [Thalassobaculum sp. OXR-137]WPZ36176.1 FkbM family methyltransferase [Thalassobaculum sp. OXR-137]